MPTRAKMTIWTLMNYDDSIFENLTLPTGIDKGTAVEKICLDCAELEVIYPDPEFMKLAISNWGMINYNKWYKLFYTETVEYDPIANVDAEEHETIDRNFHDESEGKFKGFNSSDLNDVTGGHGEGEEDVYTTKTRHGNIGVTSTQQLLNQEREVADFTIYQVISDDFKKSFCVMVY